MEEYAHRRNIERFERDLAAETDPMRRKSLEDILASEREQLERVLSEKSGTRGRTG
jgi:hypothetical protein